VTNLWETAGCGTLVAYGTDNIASWQLEARDPVTSIRGPTPWPAELACLYRSM